MEQSTNVGDGLSLLVQSICVLCRARVRGGAELSGWIGPVVLTVVPGVSGDLITCVERGASSSRRAS
jgi:hypothetical protein